MRLLPSLLLLLCTSIASALPTPDEHLKRASANPVFKVDHTGENFCWQAAYSMGDFLAAYEATDDTAWLDAGVKYYDQVLGRLAEGPDGYKGFIGPFIYNKDYWCDVHVGDAILFEHVLRFAATVHKTPGLAGYAAKANEYVDLAKKHLFDKWDARGTWHEDGPFGFYVAWDRYGKPGEYKDWKLEPANDSKSNLSLPFNKQNHMALCAMYLWQVTGDAQYKTRAERIFGFMKSRIQRHGQNYHWNYWEPAYPGDVANGKTRHWVNVHPYRNYQAGEVSQIVKAYNAGIVFTEDDIRCILNTNLKVMWNGDLKSPKYANSNKTIHPRAAATPARDKEGVAGTLWDLDQFDATARELMAKQMAASRSEIAKAHFQKTSKTPANFKRTDVQGAVTIPPAYAQLPMGDIKGLHMAAALPTTVEPGEKSILVCSLVDPGELTVTVQSADGKREVARLFEGKAANHHFVDFDTAKLPPGQYRIRWSLKGDGYREVPVTVGKQR